MEHNSCHIRGEMEVADGGWFVKFFGVKGVDRFLAASCYLLANASVLQRGWWHFLELVADFVWFGEGNCGCIRR